MDHHDLAIAEESERVESASSAALQNMFNDKTILTALVPRDPVAPPPVVSINLWQRRLRHPNETVLRKIRDTVDSGMKFSDSLMNCSASKIWKALRDHILNNV